MIPECWAFRVEILKHVGRCSKLLPNREGMVKTLEYTVVKRGRLTVPPGHHLGKTRVTPQHLMGSVKP